MPTSIAAADIAVCIMAAIVTVAVIMVAGTTADITAKGART